MTWAVFNRFEFEMPEEAVLDCSHQGSCDADVERWEPLIDMAHISDEALKEELTEYAAWGAESLEDREKNKLRIIWIAAGNLQEDIL